jgi:F-type H+-transporting ATPase subunit b
MRATNGRYWAAMLVGMVAVNLAFGLVAQDVEPAGDALPAAVEADADHPAAADDEAHDAHADVHHDPNDLTHGNMTDQATNPAEIKYDLAVYTAIVFLLLMAILAKFAWGPIAKALDERERVVSDNIADAKRLHAEAEAKLKGYEQQIAGTQEEVREMIERGKREAEVASQKIVADAEASAARERDRSVAEIQAAKNEALGELAKKSVDTAVVLAGQIVNRSLSAEDHAKLIQDAIDQFPSRN